ncbi:MAG: hypothetical protein KAJ88_02510 [Candidatus Aenigmarchaeota archaeon]|nr:hypothetical protein [Candidatus Aenigmarchaeota archaeon]
MALKSKAIAVMIAVSFLLAMSHCAFAQEPFSVKVITEKQSVYVGNSADYTLEVTNNLNETKEVQLIPTISYNSWFSMQENNTVKIGSNETKTIDVGIVPPQGTSSGNLAITVSVCQIRSNLCSDAFINLQVIDKSQLKILSFAPEIPEYATGDSAEFQFRLENLGDSNIVGYKLQIDAFDVNDVLVSNRTVDLDKIAPHSLYPRDGYAFAVLVFDSIGVYDVSAKIIDSTGGAVQTENSQVTITLPPEVPTETIDMDVVPGVFFEKTTYSVQNKNLERNVVGVEHPVRVSKLIYSFSEEPDMVSSNGEKTFMWVCDLAPEGDAGDSCEITITANYWILYLAVFLLILLSFYIYFEVEKPKVRKTHINKGEIHSIHIHVKNNSSRPLENFIVRDTVPSILNVSGDFTVKPTTMKKKHNAVELVWNLGKLKGKEERVLTYNAKPVVEVEGGISLPSVMITAVNARGRKEKVTSKSIIMS